jgi:hypothetical protein
LSAAVNTERRRGRIRIRLGAVNCGQRINPACDGCRGESRAAGECDGAGEQHCLKPFHWEVPLHFVLASHDVATIALAARRLANETNWGMFLKTQLRELFTIALFANGKNKWPPRRAAAEASVGIL